MSNMGAMFVLLLLFTLASSQWEEDVQARKTHLKSDFYRTLPRFARGCTISCEYQDNRCRGECHCPGKTNCYCTSGHHNKGCGCAC
uniref:S_Vc8.1 prepropeptide n=1 Tax=Conus victoriae TaxID=319920 RepID=W4VRY6_CONVC